MKDLLDWKQSRYRKPLLMTGVRQVGKTWLLKEFGRQSFENTAYFNFEKDQNLAELFESTKDINRIIKTFAIVAGHKIEAQKTLIILDEIQECGEALNALKYFAEDGPEYHIACAGSLLGVATARGSGFPVGKVDFLHLNPLTFTEFLLADDCQNLVDYLETLEIVESIPEILFAQFVDKLKTYFITGGMPESVKVWTEEHDVGAVQKILAKILRGYGNDFTKHSDVKDYAKISHIWDSLPSQLSKENKKFLFRLAREGARAREYEDALQWLVSAGLASKVYRNNGPTLPISAGDDLSAFKLYVVDVGLLRRHAGLAPSVFAKRNELFSVFKGALTENYILQALVNQYETTPRYWRVDHPSYEVDFLVQHDNAIVPIEVKAETNISSKSLKQYLARFGDSTDFGVRFSLMNLRKDGDILNVPLFMADHVKRLIDLQ